MNDNIISVVGGFLPSYQKDRGFGFHMGLALQSNAQALDFAAKMGGHYWKCCHSWE